MNKRRLGRGLAALLGTEEGGFEAGALEAAELILVAVDQIDPNPFQPRRDFDPLEITALADSLRQHGMLQPVLVRPVDDRYQLVAGERRLRAAIEAHLHEIPARVMELDDQRVFDVALVENLQREDLNAIEKAVAFRGYLERFGISQEELAHRLGLDRSTVSNLLRLLDLPAEAQEAVRTGKITAGHARALLSLGDAGAILEALPLICDGGLSVRETETLVAGIRPSRVRTDGGRPPIEKPPHFVELEEQLRGRFATNVLIRPRGKQKGQILIEYNTLEDFERITALIRG
ncbi:MAG: chromosome partitioning protein ParB [Isosphaeraceae bacterium]|nr:MAG: chromosome partitioning protein ParB [Isosphaeraceae bacterium]